MPETQIRKGQNFNCCSCNKIIYRTPQKIFRSKSKKYFCSKSCQTKWRNTQYVGKSHLQWRDGKSTYRDVILRSDRFKICTLCKTEDLRVLAVHHIDQDRNNFKLENLAWLCHNCHRLVHYDKVEKQNFSTEFAKVSQG